MTNIRQKILTDSSGNEAFVGVFGEQLAAKKHDDVSVQFQYPFLNTDFDLNATATAVTGDGVNTVANSYAQASSATTGTATIQSRDSIRYRPAHTGYAEFTAYFSGSGTGYAGCNDDNNGFVLKVVNGVASFGYLKGGVETGSYGAAGFDAEGSWNGSYDVSNVNWDRLNIFRITFGYLGAAGPEIWIRDGGWRHLHTVKTEGELTGTHVNTPVFPIRVRAENGMTVRTGSWGGGVIGNGSDVGSRGFTFPNTLLASGASSEQGKMQLSGTNVGTIVLFKSRDTYKTVTPHGVKSKLLSYKFEVDVPTGTDIGTVIFQILGVETLSGTPSYTPIDDDNSVMEYDHTNGTGASVNITAGVPLITDYVNYVGANKGGNTGTGTLDAEKIGAFAYSGDQFAIVAKDTGGNNVTVRITLNWEDLF